MRYIQNEFVIAARPTMPKRPAVELARVFLSHRGNAVHNAANPFHPGVDEIDMRFRAAVKLDERKIVQVGVAYLGTEAPAGVLTGWDYLARDSSRSTQNELVINNALSLSTDLSNFSILYLAGTGAFKVESTITKAISAYLEQGKGLIAEALDDTADDSFNTFFGKLGLNLKPVAEYDSILKSPYLFNAPPEGNQGSRVLLGKKVIYSNAKYSIAWSGKVLGGTGSRADIRSALEWGLNMISYCL
jgi:hypothetical protein